LLQINHLSKQFGTKTALNDITFRFDNGVYGLLGANGAGKTTMMRCLTKLYPVPKNTIYYKGNCITTNKNFCDNIGYLPQKFGLFKDLKVYEMMQLMANLKKVNKSVVDQNIRNCIEIVNLTDRIDSKVGSLSGGMLRRLGIAQVLLNNPHIMIFDEPTAGLDPEERLRFKNIITQIKDDKIIIISTHIVEDVEAVCDQVAIMKEGKIIFCGTCQEIENFAKDKVYVLPKNRIYEINGQYTEQKHFERDGVHMVKIVSSDPQNIDSCKPNIEDGYICIIKEQ